MQTTQANDVNEYRERYVAFLDLLGFKVLVEHAETDQIERERLTEAVDRLRRTLCNNPAIGMRFTYFSDCIMVTAERSPRGLWELLTSLHLDLQSTPTQCFGARGNDVGGALHNEQFVYHTAVSRAAVIEKDQATVPSPCFLLRFMKMQKPMVSHSSIGFKRMHLGTSLFTIFVAMRSITIRRRFPARSASTMTQPGSYISSVVDCRGTQAAF